MSQIQNKAKKTKFIIEKKELLDQKTGEIYTFSTTVENNQKKRYKRKTKAVDQFIRLFHEYILDLFYSKTIEYDELSLLTSLVLFIDWNSNKVIDQKGKPLSITQLSKLLNKHRTWLTERLNRLKTKGLIYLDEENGSLVITISPKVAWKGDAW